MDIKIGEKYRNIKHGTIYHVLGFSRHSETLEKMIRYERIEPEEREEIPWDRPMEIFLEKFEEVKRDCFDCKFYDSNDFICMYDCRCYAILDERKSYKDCKWFVEGKFDEDELEKSNYR